MWAPLSHPRDCGLNIIAWNPFLALLGTRAWETQTAVGSLLCLRASGGWLVPHRPSVFFWSRVPGAWLTRPVPFPSGTGGVEMPCPQLPEIGAWRCEWERMPHAEAALEFLQRPGFPVQLPAGQNLRSLKGPGSLATTIKGTWLPTLPCVSEIGAQCKPGQGVCQGVSIPRVV